MSEIDPITGLPKELGAWESITKEGQKIIVKTEKKKFNKVYTIVQGIDEKEIDMKQVIKMLKNKLACGGTVKGGKIELQGSHVQKTKLALIAFGFAPETIEVRS